MYEPLGVPRNYATDPAVNSPYATPMSFSERLYNFVRSIRLKYIEIDSWPRINKITKELFGISYTTEVLKDVSLLLLNYYPALNGVRSLPQNIIPIGGLHIIDRNETLPKVC